MPSNTSSTLGGNSVRKEGITVLYTPSVEDSPVIADIVFVHGLQGHPVDTWQHKLGHQELEVKRQHRHRLISKKLRAESENVLSSPPMGTYWPRDLLPKDQKKTRIMTYGYDSAITKFFSGPTSKLNMSQLGLSLLNAVVNERIDSDSSDRPIIFIAHSLGGLLVKEALVESKKQSPDSSRRSLYLATTNIVFFGTPHRGSQDAQWGLIMARIVSVAGDANNKILRALTPGSELLDKLAKDFTDILEEDKLRITTMLESKGKIGLAIGNSKVVEDSSAQFGSRKYEYIDHINQNHMNMCKFEDRDDDGYRKVLSRLKEYTTKIDKALILQKESAAQSKAQTLERDFQALADSLKYDDLGVGESFSDDIARRSFDWFWAMEAYPTSFKAWFCESSCFNSGIFWIQGHPGTGKTTLMKYLKEYEFPPKRDPSIPSRSRKWLKIYHFFDSKAFSGTKNTLNGMLRALMYRLMSHLQRSDHRSWNLCLPPSFVSWDFASLVSTICNLLRDATDHFLILIDGLDEVEGGEEAVMGTLDVLKKIARYDRLTRPARRIKVCVASRSHPIIYTSIGESYGFEMHRHNLLGIHAYADYRLKNAMNSSLASPSSVKLLVDMICERSSGSYLWAKFDIEQVAIGIAVGEDAEGFHWRVHQVPKELKTIYARMTKEAVYRNRNSAEMFMLLQIASFTPRPLTLYEVYMTIQLSLGKSFSKSDNSWIRFASRIRGKAGGLVEVVRVGSEQRLQLIHHSLQMYLYRYGGYFCASKEWYGGDEKFEVPMDTCRVRTESGQRPLSGSTLVPSVQVQRMPALAAGHCRNCHPPSHQEDLDHLVREHEAKPLAYQSLTQTSSTITDWVQEVKSHQNSVCSLQTLPCGPDLPLRLVMKKGFSLELVFRVQTSRLQSAETSDAMYLDVVGLYDIDQVIKAAEDWTNARLQSYLDGTYQPLRRNDPIFSIITTAARGMWKEPECQKLLRPALTLWSNSQDYQDGWVLNVTSDDGSKVACPPILRYQLEAIFQICINKRSSIEVVENLHRTSKERPGNAPPSAIILVMVIAMHLCDTEIARYRYTCTINHGKGLRCPQRQYLHNLESTAIGLLLQFKRCPDGQDPLSSCLGTDPTTIELLRPFDTIIPASERRMSRYMNVDDFDGKPWFLGQLFVDDWNIPPSVLCECKRPTTWI